MGISFLSKQDVAENDTNKLRNNILKNTLFFMVVIVWLWKRIYKTAAI